MSDDRKDLFPRPGSALSGSLVGGDDQLGVPPTPELTAVERRWVKPRTISLAAGLMLVSGGALIGFAFALFLLGTLCEIGTSSADSMTALADLADALVKGG